jgi:hypothetical protein
VIKHLKDLKQTWEQAIALAQQEAVAVSSTVSPSVQFQSPYDQTNARSTPFASA